MLTRISTPPPDPRGHGLLLTPPPSGGADGKTTRFIDVENGPHSTAQITTFALQQKLLRPNVADGLDSPSMIDLTGTFGGRELTPAKPIDEDFEDTRKPFRLMDLPLKIRERIYGFLLQVAGVIILKQNKTPLQHYPTPYSNMDSRILKPGIAWASTQTIMGAGKARFWSHPSTNVRILRANKQVYAEAKPLLYGINLFEFSNLSNESSPRADFSIPIFPRGIPKLIKHVCIRAGAFYGLGWMLQHGHKHLKNYYRGVESLILILELGAVTRGYGKILARQDNEKWVTYVERIQQSMRLMGGVRENVDDILKWQLKPVPTWIDFRVVFQAERIMDGVGMDEKYEEELDVKKVEIKRAVAEAFELFKRGGF